MKKAILAVLLLLLGQPLAAQLHFETQTLDIKSISEDDTPSVYTFHYVNDSEKPVVITSVETTCGCARPQYTKTPILAGGKGTISVTFYPKGHPGTLNRSVYVRTSASSRPVQLTLMGTVTPTADRYFHYPYRKGTLRLKQEEVRFGVLQRSLAQMHRIEVVNAGTRPLHLSLAGAPAYLKFRTEPEVIAPDSVGDLVFILNPAALKPGSLKFEVMLDGVSLPPSQRVVKVSAEIK